MVNDKGKKMRHTNIPACYLILEKGNSVLLARRFNTGYQDGKYSLVAGHLDPGETFTQAMVREALEEADIQIKPADLRVVHVMHRKSSVSAEERVDIFFKAVAWAGEPKNIEPHKCDDMCWFDYGTLPENTIPHVRFALQQVSGGVFYSEVGW